MPVRHRIPVLIAAVTAASMTLASCAREISPDVQSGRAAGELQRTYTGTIESVRVIDLREDDMLEDNRLGQIVGGAAGGAAGSTIGQGTGKAVAIGAGALLGAVAGSMAERELKQQTALEYIVRTDNGQLLTVVQGPGAQLRIGQRVYVQESVRGRGRIIPAA